MDTAEENPVAKLTVIFHNKVLSIWELPRGVSRIIGRGAEVHYQIKSGILSRRHCEIKDTKNGIEIKDLSSLNGILVNQEKVFRCILKDGDEIQLGLVIIKVALAKKNGKFVEIEKNYTTLASEKREEEIVVYASPWNRPTPSGACIACGKKLSADDIASHLGIFNKDKIYCMSCFCDGAGDFPTIAGYRIVKKIGKGGMGEIYEAVQLSMERPVAFKLMKGLQAVKESQLKRFFREARIGGKLTHANIVGFIDSGNFEKNYFLTMEFIYGKDVKYMIKMQDGLPCKEALRIAYYVACALDYAYSRYSVIHRDIKPSNVLVDRDNTVKLTDFGLSKSIEDAGLSPITRTKTGVGTAFYMAPEQISDSRNVDQRVDIYGLGVTLYEMLTGARPFIAEQIVTLINKIQKEQPAPITDLVPNLPAQIWPIVSKAMAKEPKQRYQTAHEMKEALHCTLKMLGYEFH